jgi:alcohol dehydrogenase (cytochrome c)
MSRRERLAVMIPLVLVATVWVVLAAAALGGGCSSGSTVGSQSGPLGSVAGMEAMQPVVTSTTSTTAPPNPQDLPPTTLSGAPVVVPSTTPAGGAAQPAPASQPPQRSFLTAPAPALPADIGTMQANAESEPGNWLLYGRTYKSWRYSPLTQITPSNAGQLKLAWSLDTGEVNAFEASPIVVNGVMYFSTPWNNVLAVDAVTGKQYWRYVHEFTGHPVLCCDAPNRGVGVGAGRVVMATLDARLVALDATTGKLDWDVTMADVKNGYSATLAPQVIGDKVIVGISGGEYGIRGFVDCYDIRTGKRIWRWYTIPGPGQPGNETWQGDSWQHGGVPSWMTCSYDPAMNTIFCGLGNAGPDINGDKRAGLNLYATCVVALDLATGSLRWYYQTVPHDVWDLDCTTSPMIDDLTVNGQPRKVVMFGCKNGYFYMLDRTTGKPIHALKVCDYVSWGTVSPEGVPSVNDIAIPSAQGTTVAPGASGGKEWANEAYDPVRKLAFIPLTEEPFTHTKEDQPFLPGEFFWGGFSNILAAYGHVSCVDVTTQEIKWVYHTEFPQICSLCCTASGLVITGTADRRMIVLDSETGKELYAFYGVSGFHGNPITFAVKGKQYIAMGNGWGGPPQGTGTGKIAGQPTANTMYVWTLP